MDLPHEEGKTAFLDALQRYLTTVETLDDRQLLAPTRCYGWSVVDLLVHLNLSLQEMNQDFSATTDREPEVDAATYWLTDLPRSDPGAERWTRSPSSAGSPPPTAGRPASSATSAASSSTNSSRTASCTRIRSAAEQL